MRKAIKPLQRFIATPPTQSTGFLFGYQLPFADEARRHRPRRRPTFGILHSRFHELWSLRLGTSLEDRPRYTPTTTFETFPFPAGMTPRDTAPKAGQATPPCMAGDILAENIAAAARRLNELREAWLNPPEWVDWVITPEEEKAGFPKRPVAKPGHEADLKKRTLTNLYNARPRLARHGPQSPRPGRRRRLRLADYSRHARRRNPPPPAGAESGTGCRLMPPSKYFDILFK
jgi:hypothetical protein